MKMYRNHGEMLLKIILLIEGSSWKFVWVILLSLRIDELPASSIENWIKNSRRDTISLLLRIYESRDLSWRRRHESTIVKIKKHSCVQRLNEITKNVGIWVTWLPWKNYFHWVMCLNVILLRWVKLIMFTYLILKIFGNLTCQDTLKILM